MRKISLIALILLTSILTANAQISISDLNGLRPTSPGSSLQTIDDLFGPSQKSNQNASIRFRNNSDYSMTLKLIYAGRGGLYTTVSLPPHSSSMVYFSSSGKFKLKIKATPRYGNPSYHDGGNFSVTCTSTQWTEGEMSFQLSSHGSGLGPSISAQQFESNY